jgi:hypothetical protein
MVFRGLFIGAALGPCSLGMRRTYIVPNQKELSAEAQSTVVSRQTTASQLAYQPATLKECKISWEPHPSMRILCSSPQCGPHGSPLIC